MTDHLTLCSLHPDRAAVYRCRPCSRALCHECTASIRPQGRVVLTCGDCGALVEQLPAGPPATASLGMHRPIWERMADIFGYAGKRSTLLVVGATAVITSFVYWLPFGVVLGAGIEAALFFRVLLSSARGEHELEAPDFSHLWEDVLGPLVRYVAALGPIVASFIMIGLSGLTALIAVQMGESPFPYFANMLGALGVLFLGLLLLPLMLAIAAIGQSIVAMYNPVVWLESLRQMRWDYAAGAGMFYVLLLIEYVVLLPILAVLRVFFDVPILMTILILFAQYMISVLQFRVIGVMCEPYMERNEDHARVAGSLAEVPEPGSIPVGIKPQVPVARVVSRSAAMSPGAGPARGAVPFAPVNEPPAQAPALAALRLALAAGDGDAVRAQASAAMESMARDPALAPQLLATYQELVTAQAVSTLSDRALLAAAVAADATGDAPIVVGAVRTLMAQHPQSPLVPRALWLVAGAQERAGRHDLMQTSLRRLIERAPMDPFADQARRRLEQLWSQT